MTGASTARPARADPAPGAADLIVATQDLIVVADVDGVAAPAAVRVGGLHDGAVGGEEGVVVGARVETLVAC